MHEVHPQGQSTSSDMVEDPHKGGVTSVFHTFRPTDARQTTPRGAAPDSAHVVLDMHAALCRPRRETLLLPIKLSSAQRNFFTLLRKKA